MSASSEVLNYLPEITTAAGYAVGQVADVAAAKFAANRKEATISNWGMPAGAETTRKRSIVGRIVAPLAIVGALSGGISAIAWSSENSHHSVLPVLENVVDHSFQTNDGTITENNSVALRFNHDTSLNVRAYVAHNGGYDPIQLGDLSKDGAYGPASLEPAVGAAMADAFNNSVVGSSNIPGTNNRRSAALLVETDDHPIGDVKTVVNEAKQDGDLPIFIVNTGDKGGAKDQTSKDLQAIASQTGGQYWAATKSNSSKLASQVSKSITPNQVAEPAPSDNKGWLKVLSILSGVGFVEITRRRMKVKH